MKKQKMIRSMEFKGKKLIDKGLVPMTKREQKLFERYDKRVKEGKEIWTEFEPYDLMSKLVVDVTKDKRGNVSVFVRQPNKDECHHGRCTNKVVKNYMVCRKHLK